MRVVAGPGWLFLWLARSVGHNASKGLLDNHGAFGQSRPPFSEDYINNGHYNDVNDDQCHSSSDRVLLMGLFFSGSLLFAGFRGAIYDYVNIGQTLDPKRCHSLAAAAWCMARDRTGCAGDAMLSAQLQ